MKVLTWQKMYSNILFTFYYFYYFHYDKNQTTPVTQHSHGDQKKGESREDHKLLKKRSDTRLSGKHKDRHNLLPKTGQASRWKPYVLKHADDRYEKVQNIY